MTNDIVSGMLGTTVDVFVKRMGALPTVGNVAHLPYNTDSFDLALSINVFHNLYVSDLFTATCEVERVARSKYVVVDSYRNEHERANLMYWQLTCECFYTPSEWEWILGRFGYRGDYSCVYYQ